MPCSIVRDEIDLEDLRRRAQDPQAGAVLIFCGDVSNHSQEKDVLTYLDGLLEIALVNLFYDCRRRFSRIFYDTGSLTAFTPI